MVEKCALLTQTDLLFFPAASKSCLRVHVGWKHFRGTQSRHVLQVPLLLTLQSLHLIVKLVFLLWLLNKDVPQGEREGFSAVTSVAAVLCSPRFMQEFCVCFCCAPTFIETDSSFGFFVWETDDQGRDDYYHIHNNIFLSYQYHRWRLPHLPNHHPTTRQSSRRSCVSTPLCNNHPCTYYLDLALT